MFGWMRRSRNNRQRGLGTTLAALGAALVLLVVCLAPPVPSHAANPPKKEARVNNDAKANGTSANPIPVRLNDKITYDITVDKDAPAGARYDVLFVVDWSASMSGGTAGGYMPDANGRWVHATSYARELIMKMSEYVFANYPGSRVALMGVNAVYSNKNDPQQVCLQYDTSFVGASGYSSVLSPSLNATMEYYNDDNAQFLRAAVDKMKGDTSVSYGANTKFAPRTVVPRDELNAGRIPCIVQISDFQMEDQVASGGLGGPYWSSAMKGQADRFASAFPTGILLTVRLDHKRSTTALTPPSQTSPNGAVNPYNGTRYDNFMTTYVSPAGRAKWQFTQLAHTDNATAGLNKVKNVFNAAAPPPVVMSVKDTIPEGLSIVSTSPTASVNGRTVTWDLMTAPSGKVNLTVVTKVTAPTQSNGGNYVNTAIQSVQGKSDVNTNATYHRLASDLVLHLREVVASPVAGTPKPLAGYFRLKNDGREMQVTGESGVHGFGLTDYTKYKLKLSGTDKLYHVYDFVPQHYEYAGHFQSRGSAAASGHDNPASMVLPAACPNGQIALDYGVDSEYWLTVYIRPVGTPGDFEWSYASNNFGAVS